MDPTTNSTPTPNPEPSPVPAPESTPVPEAPATPPTEPAVTPSSTPAASVTPATPTTPTTPATPTTTTTPGQTPSMVAGGITTAPVNPIINPTGAATVGGVTKPADGLAATDPIMKPEPAPEPDPVEEELKAPMKAAAPVPGSIGSAVSGPADGEAPAEGATASVDMTAGNKADSAKPENPLANLFGKHEKKTPSVAFNDPAAQSDEANGGTPAAGGTKKTNKITLIALIGVAAVIIVILIVVLVIQMNSGSSSNNNNVGGDNNNSVVADEPDEPAEPDEPETPVATIGGTLSCTRNMTAAELARLSDAVSGSVMMSAEFDESDMLTNIALIHSVVYSDDDSTNNEPVQETVREDTAENIDATSALQYELPLDKENNVDFSFAGIRANYESLDFTCEAL